ncbi:HtaA domain-containing protein [Streptomyces albus subsp. chlorinus]|uniref:HtaA domain-containing protein n=1 Tax=Streptomyces albus TaxID=1888 RepID=UPI003D0B6604
MARASEPSCQKVIWVSCALSALAAPGTVRTAAPAAAPALPLTGGTLDWGVKKSFRACLTGRAGGKITVGTAPEPTTTAPPASPRGRAATTRGRTLSPSFHGSVHLYGHHGALDIKLSGFSVRTGGRSGTLTADLATGTGEKGDGEPKETKDDVPLAALDLFQVTPASGRGGEMTFADIPTTLTPRGRTRSGAGARPPTAGRHHRGSRRARPPLRRLRRSDTAPVRNRTDGGLDSPPSRASWHGRPTGSPGRHASSPEGTPPRTRRPLRCQKRAPASRGSAPGSPFTAIRR